MTTQIYFVLIMCESVISETIYLKVDITNVALIGVSMATEAKTWHLVFFLAVFVGYRNKTPDNIVILKCAVQVIDA